MQTNPDHLQFGCSKQESRERKGKERKGKERERERERDRERDVCLWILISYFWCIMEVIRLFIPIDLYALPSLCFLKQSLM